MGEERRQFIRATSRLTAFIKYVDTGKVRRALTKDVSAGGMCVITEELLSPGAKVEVELKLPDWDKPIICAAEVVWSRPMGEARKSYENPTAETGLRFVNLAPKDQVLLKQYAALNAPPPKDSDKS